MGRIAVALIVSSWIIPISLLVDHIVPHPYMDEIFHVPQAQQYCKGNFKSWDPMITTPPGLYFLSLAYVASLFPGIFSVQAGSSFSDVCSTAILRSTNGILAVICSILIYEIICCVRPALGERKATVYAVILSLYPVHWFFTFLYYTDVASLTAVLAMYLMCLKKNYLFSALLGALAVLIRQTNILWMLFVACNGVIDCSLPHEKDGIHFDDSSARDQNSAESVSNKGVAKISNLRRRRFGNTDDIINGSFFRTGGLTAKSGLFSEMHEIFLALWHLKWRLLVTFSPFFLVLMGFAAFVYWNGSIVLGAKEAHAVSPHVAQLLYFSLISALFTGPFHCSLREALILLSKYSKIQWLVALFAGFLSVHLFSIAHPYLLADNRHYPFYLWRKVIKAHWSMKYFLVPLYIYTWLSICSILAKGQKKIWVLAYFMTSAAALIPAPLIEFRYYTVPFFFFVLHARVNDYRSWLLMGATYVAINTITMTMFLFRPFRWEHEAGTQRFIW